MRSGRAPVLGEPLQHRQAERGGLAGAGLRDAEQVAARKQHGMARLDRSGLGVFLGGERAQKRLGKSERFKRIGIQTMFLNRTNVRDARADNGLLPSSTHIWSEREFSMEPAVGTPNCLARLVRPRGDGAAYRGTPNKKSRRARLRATIRLIKTMP